jgi:uncharacterized membrane protein YesL
MACVRRFFWTAYDHLGSLVMLNLVWDLLSLPWLLAGGWLVGVGLGLRGDLAAPGLAICLFAAGELVFFAPPAVLLFMAGSRWVRGQQVETKALCRQLPRFAVRVQALGLLILAVTLVLLVNAAFYLRWQSWLGLGLAGLMVWLLVVVGLTAPYILPVLVTQDAGLRQTLRCSFLLALDNLALSAGLLASVLAAVLVGVGTGIGLFVGGLAALALWLSVRFQGLLGKYTGTALPEEPPRRLRELLRPWEG